MDKELKEIECWKNLRSKIDGVYNYNNDWLKAITLFKKRLRNKYFEPIEELIRKASFEGEGFTILTAQCAIIESLASFRTGEIYNYKMKSYSPSFEYKDSKKLKLDLYNAGDWWVKKDEITGQSFYRGEKIWLKKAISTYHLWFQFEVDFLVVGFHIDDKDKVDIEENIFEKNDTWLVFKNFGTYPDVKTKMEDWVEQVIGDIPSIENIAKIKQ